MTRIAAAALIAALTAAWLHWGVAVVAPAVSSMSGAAGEAAFTGVVYLPLVVLATIGGVATRTTVWRAGQRPARATARGAGLGVGGLLLATGYAALAGTLRGGAGEGGAALVAGVAVVLFQVLAEEGLFRGLLQPLLVGVIGEWPGLLAGAALFAALHAVAGLDGPVALLNLFAGGLLFGALAREDRGLAGAVAAHAGWNMSEQLLLGLDPNPGTGGFGSAIDLDLAGKAVWGGSAAGLNGSWAMAFALAAILVPLLLWQRAKPVS